MARHYHEKDIDGRTFVVQEFPATEGLRLLVALGKILGKPLGSVLSGLRRGEDTKIDMSLLGQAVGELADRLGEDEILRVIKRLLASTQCDNVELKGPAFDTVFMRAYATLFKVIAFVLEVNYDIPLDVWNDALIGIDEETSTPEQSSAKLQPK